MKYALSLPLFFLLTLTISSCSKRPSDVLAKDKMTDVLYDVQLLQAISDGSTIEFGTPEFKEQLMQGVYEKHKITAAILDSSIMWYSDNLNLYNEISDSILSRLSRERDRLRDEELALSGRLSSQGGGFPSYFYLNKYHAVYSFVIDSVQLKLSEKPFQLQFDIQGLNSANKQKVEAGVYYIYRDTSIQQIQQINRDSHYIISKPSLSDSLLIEIRGYIRLKKKDMASIPVLVYNVLQQDATSTNALPNRESFRESR